jgi:hypothetical protein
MSTRYNHGSHYENHQRAAELHDAAAHAHRAAGQHGQQDHLTGHELSRQALELSHEAHRHTETATTSHGFREFKHEDIAARASELWSARGCPEGSPEQDWFLAVKELREHKDSLAAPGRENPKA